MLGIFSMICIRMSQIYPHTSLFQYIACPGINFFSFTFFLKQKTTFITLLT